MAIYSEVSASAKLTAAFQRSQEGPVRTDSCLQAFEGLQHAAHTVEEALGEVMAKEENLSEETERVLFAARKLLFEMSHKLKNL